MCVCHPVQWVLAVKQVTLLETCVMIDWTLYLCRLLQSSKPCCQVAMRFVLMISVYTALCVSCWNTLWYKQCVLIPTVTTVCAHSKGDSSV